MKMAANLRALGTLGLPLDQWTSPLDCVDRLGFVPLSVVKNGFPPLSYGKVARVQSTAKKART